MQGIAKVAIGGIRCEVCKQSGEERGTVLGVNLAGSGDSVLKKMYNVPVSNLKFGKWQERPLKVYRYMAFIVLVVIQLWSLGFINVTNDIRDKRVGENEGVIRGNGCGVGLGVWA
ncbi:hypothetical protein Tco_0081054, partial [Tanacetum coccineum]